MTNTINKLIAEVIKEIQMKQMNMTTEVGGTNDKVMRDKAIKHMQALNELVKHLLKYQKCYNDCL